LFRGIKGNKCMEAMTHVRRLLRAGPPKACSQAVYDDALRIAFGTDDGGHAKSGAPAPRLLQARASCCFYLTQPCHTM
jgi:hypothetical protein